MKISSACIPCLARQLIEISEESTQSLADEQKIIKAGLKILGSLEFNQTAPEIAYEIHQVAKKITKIQDPYKNLKKEYNLIAQKIYDRIIEEKWMEKAEDKFDLACRLAIAGNIIDFSVGLNLTEKEILDSVEKSIETPLWGKGTQSLQKAILSANQILFIADNAGEIIFDKFLLDQLPLEKVIFAVKGQAIVNDATLEDAQVAGITKKVKVIDNGFGAQGTILSQCSESFLNYFERADLIISKGQANYETLSDRQDKKIFYLMRAKCSVIANSLGCQPMDYVLTC